MDLNALWQGPAIVTVLIVTEAMATILSLAPPKTVDSLWVHFGLISFTSLWIVMLALTLLYIFKQPTARLSREMQYAAMLAALLSSTLLTSLLVERSYLTDYLIESDIAYSHGIAAKLVLVFIAGATGIVIFDNLDRMRQSQMRTKQAELTALQARVHPHFLFNTLNTAAALVHERPDEAERLLLDLSDLFRAALSGPQEILLSDEIALAKRYVEIESLRFGERLRIDWDLPDDLPDAKVPSLAIQTLLENAIKHGVEPAPAGGRIRVAVDQEPGLIHIRIENSIHLNPSAHRGHQVGLQSSIARIEALTEGRGQVTTEKIDGIFVATIRLPQA